MVRPAVRADIEKQRVLVAVHLLGHPTQRTLEVGNGGERKLLQRLLAVDERDGMAGGGKALIEEPPHVAHFVHEDILARVGCEADEEKLARARTPGLHGVERPLDQLALQMKKPLLREWRRRIVFVERLVPYFGAGEGKEADGDHR